MTAEFSRRRLLSAAGAGSVISLLPSSGWATPESMQDAIAEAYGQATITPGRVTLSVPPLAENGNSVAVRVAVESAMSNTDRVTELTLFSAANPLPVVSRLEFGPMAAKAEASFRIRLADSQRLVAVARMSDETLWSGSATTIVTLAACTDFLF